MTLAKYLALALFLSSFSAYAGQTSWHCDGLLSARVDNSSQRSIRHVQLLFTTSDDGNAPQPMEMDFDGGFVLKGSVVGHGSYAFQVAADKADTRITGTLTAADTQTDTASKGFVMETDYSGAFGLLTCGN
jgi:hypothetical protein